LWLLLLLLLSIVSGTPCWLCHSLLLCRLEGITKLGVVKLLVKFVIVLASQVGLGRCEEVLSNRRGQFLVKVHVDGRVVIVYHTDCRTLAYTLRFCCLSGLGCLLHGFEHLLMDLICST
jgi:hypothetical protein